MLPLLFLVHTLILSAEQSPGVFLWGEVVPTEVRLGDVVFMEISAHNRGDSPARIPATCLLETGTLSVEICDREEFTTFRFFPDGGPMGGDVPEIVLQPGQGHVVALLMLRLPRLDWTGWRFWDPAKWRPTAYYLDLQCGELRGRTERIFIGRRPEKEMEALLEYYDGGFKAPVPPGWDIDRPTLGVFGLLSFPLVCSLPEELARMEEKLSPGSLREIFHATRLTAAVYDAKTPEKKRGAAAELLEWLDQRAEIQRHWMAMELVSWGLRNKGLGEYSFEFVDRVIPCLPESYMGDNWQEKYREENESLRRWYLEHVRQRKQPERSRGV